MSVEPDNIIQDANDSGVSSDGEPSVVVNGAIDFGNDVDLYQFQANAGEDVILDLDANEFGSSLDGRLRLFDADGNEIGNNDDRPAPGEVRSVDAFLSFTPSSSANYYIGVSNVGNSDYDPNVVSDEVSTQAVVGEYTLEISLADETESDPDNIIAKAIDTGLDGTGQSASFSDEIDNLGDVDIYQVQLDPGEALLVDVDAVAIGSDLLASDLLIFDEEGNNLSELATIDDSRLSRDSNASRIGGDPDLTFIAESAGNYYIGVSGGGFDLPVYNPINGIKSSESLVSGTYEINFDILEVTSDRDPDNTIAEAVATELNSSGELTVLNGTVDNGDDVDIYQIQLDAGSALTFDIDTADSGLLRDLVLRLFDGSGNLVASANEDSGSADAPTFDPFLAFEAEATGDYYLGVSTFQNSEYDPVAGTTNIPQNREVGGIDFESVDYELSIDLTQDDIAVDPEPDSDLEPNSDPDATIASAIALELENPGDTVTLDDAINFSEDVDLYRVRLEAGEGLTFDIDSNEGGSILDSRLRLFDADGNEIDGSDDDTAPGEQSSLDPFLAFTADTAGDYYVGVSEFANFAYDPVAGGQTNDAVGETGEYTLEASLFAQEPEPETPEPENPSSEQDNIIAGAIATELSEIGQSATFSDAIEPIEDVDLYQVQLDAGEGLIIDIDAAELLSSGESAFGLDSLLRLFDADGNEIATNDDGSAPGEEFSLDSFLTFTANSSGDYYVGVSSIANSGYNPITGGNNDEGSGDTGDYNLSLEIVEVTTIDEDPDNTIVEAISTGIDSVGQSATFSDAIDPETDADLYRVQLDAGDNLLVDLDANELGSDLDGRLRLFNAAGNELASVDDLPAPGEEEGLDAYIDFTADVSGDYYVGVSDFINSQYDPINGTTNIFQPTGNTTGNYSLILEIAADNVDNLEPVFADFDRVTGTDSPDILFGNSNSTFVDALNGDDVVTGASNDDYLLGGAGSDVLSGNNGNDTLIGGLGFDVLSGGEGDDFLQGDEDTNTLFGGAGADIFAIADNGNNTIADFKPDTDKIQLLGSLSFADLTIEDVAGGAGAVISSSSNSTITTVPGVTASNLSETDFLAG